MSNDVKTRLAETIDLLERALKSKVKKETLEEFFVEQLREKTREYLRSSFDRMPPHQILIALDLIKNDLFRDNQDSKPIQDQKGGQATLDEKGLRLEVQEPSNRENAGGLRESLPRSDQRVADSKGESVRVTGQESSGENKVGNRSRRGNLSSKK